MDPHQTIPNTRPNPYIFPGQLHNSDVQMDTAIDLKQKFLNIESALVHAGNIYVESASYRKNKNGPQHEFIVFRVRDKSDPNMHNCLALDRLPRHERETCPDVGSVEQEGEFDPNAASDTPPK